MILPIITRNQGKRFIYKKTERLYARAIIQNENFSSNQLNNILKISYLDCPVSEFYLDTIDLANPKNSINMTLFFIEKAKQISNNQRFQQAKGNVEDNLMNKNKNKLLNNYDGILKKQV